MLIQTGIPDKEAIEAVTPNETRFLKGAVAIAECFQKIPCNPCTKACVKKAIHIEPDINETPKIDFDVCNGCGACMLKCPGLAIFIVDKTYSPTEALVKLPFEFLPLLKRRACLRSEPLRRLSRLVPGHLAHPRAALKIKPTLSVWRFRRNCRHGRSGNQSSRGVSKWMIKNTILPM